MGAVVIGCLAATVTSGAYAQETNTTGQFYARAGRQQPSTSAQPSASMRQRKNGAMNEQFNSRAPSGRASASGQLERRALANEGRMNGPTRRTSAGERGMRGERFTYARISAERGWRGRGLYARAGAEGGYRSERGAYRDRAVDVGAVVAAADYGYRTQRLYAYAPTYDVGYVAEPYYNYAPGYEVAITTGPITPGPHYAPDWNVAYAGPEIAPELRGHGLPLASVRHTSVSMTDPRIALRSVTSVQRRRRWTAYQEGSDGRGAFAPGTLSDLRSPGGSPARGCAKQLFTWRRWWRRRASPRPARRGGAGVGLSGVAEPGSRAHRRGPETRRPLYYNGGLGTRHGSAACGCRRCRRRTIRDEDRG